MLTCSSKQNTGCSMLGPIGGPDCENTRAILVYGFKGPKFSGSSAMDFSEALPRKWMSTLGFSDRRGLNYELWTPNCHQSPFETLDHPAFLSKHKHLVSNCLKLTCSQVVEMKLLSCHTPTLGAIHKATSGRVHLDSMFFRFPNYTFRCLGVCSFV